LLLVPGLSAERLNKIYDYYFSALRAATRARRWTSWALTTSWTT
jgi:hypothetical protein